MERRKVMKIGWTRTELKKFGEWRNLDMDLMIQAENKMWGFNGTKEDPELDKEIEERDRLEAELKSLMGTTRFNILINGYSETMKSWEKEINARYIKKHPWCEPDGFYDCYE